MSTSEQHRLGTSLKIFVDFKKMNFSAYNMLFHSVIVSFMEFYQLIEVLSLSTNLSRAFPRSPQHRTNQTLWLLAVVDDNPYKYGHKYYQVSPRPTLSARVPDSGQYKKVKRSTW